MKVSFVIVNYNRREELLITIRKTKELIKAIPAEFEIVIVDNASTDGSAAAVKNKFPDVVLIEREVNIGAPAWNDGFAKATGDYFIILDDDSHIESGLQGALTYIENHPEVGVLALNVTTGPYISEMWQWKDGEDIIGFIGCGAIFRKEAYEKVGGYADWMFLYVNEWELGIRCHNAGYKVRFYENCIVNHRASKSHRSNKRLHVLVTQHELGIVYKYFSENRFKYLLTVAINNLKFWRYNRKALWYNLLGMKSFLKLRKSLAYTPVSPEVQAEFVEKFYSLWPPFAFIKRGFKRLFEKTKVAIGLNTVSLE